jgi:hypothetical protein
MKRRVSASTIQHRSYSFGFLQNQRQIGIRQILKKPVQRAQLVMRQRFCWCQVEGYRGTFCHQGQSSDFHPFLTP